MKSKLILVTVTYCPDSIELKQCLYSIFKYNDIGDRLKVIVVDNSPVDQSIIPSFSKQFNTVQFISAPENKGFGYSNNLGANSVDSDYILFFNNDTELIQPIFKELIQRMNADSSVGCSSIKQADNSQSFFEFPECSLTYFSKRIRQKFDLYNESDFYLSGAFMFFRRDAFKQCGQFDEGLFMYCEEPDICNRLKRCGYHLAYHKDLSFVHKIGNRHVHSPQTYEQNAISLTYYLKKYHLEHLAKRILFSNVIRWEIKSFIYSVLNEKAIARNIRYGIKVYKQNLNGFL